MALRGIGLANLRGKKNLISNFELIMNIDIFIFVGRRSGCGLFYLAWLEWLCGWFMSRLSGY